MPIESIYSAINDTRTDAESLNEKEKQIVLIRLLERLGVDATSHAPWDKRDAPEGTQRSDGWELIPNYVGPQTCLMFLSGAEVIWRFRTSSDLLRVLEESPPVEFYVCDEEASYLLCRNHHDFIIGWGAAARWVEGSSPNGADPNS